ncbi:MAG: sulfatase family protein [Casimicrobiaceae bacterium]
MKQPHVLILMTDQQRADCMGCAGHPQLKTPNIDRLAREGMRFAQATTASPICMPARASFASGLYPHNHGMWANQGELPAADETFFQLLQSAGYHTAQVGKTHFYEHKAGMHLRDREPYMHARGLEYVHETTGPRAARRTVSYMTEAWMAKGLLGKFVDDYRARARSETGGVWPSPLPVEDFLDSYIGRKAVEFVGGYDDRRPMCLFVGFGGPHEPWDAPGRYAEMYKPEDAPRPIPIPAGYAALPDAVKAKRDFAVLPAAVMANVPSIRANYYGKISLIDDNIGYILEAFERRGWLDDLLVVFLSDHGEMLGDHGRLRKSTFHEASVRIPLVMRWPERIPANVVSEALAEIVDVFPTVVEAGGGTPSTRCLGRSLWPLIREEGTELRDWQVSEIVYGDARVMLRSRRRKLAIDAHGVAFMLYDLERDPEEQHNLVADPAARPEEFRLRECLASALKELRYDPRVPQGAA